MHFRISYIYEISWKKDFNDILKRVILIIRAINYAGEHRENC